MAKEKKKRKGRERKGAAPGGETLVDLSATVSLLHEHVTESVCSQVFRDARHRERERKWCLFAMARFWLAVILDPPRALSDHLDRARRGDRRGLLPLIDASAQAFFAKAKSLSSVFFAQLYATFVDRVLPTAPQNYCAELADVARRFRAVLAIDGSRLDKVAHRLKILWDEKAAILPGALLALYDLRRGFATQLWFDSDAASSEFQRALLAIEGLEAETLVVGDRLYSSPKLLRALDERGCFGVFRRSKAVKPREVRRLGRWKSEGALVEDWRVKAGRENDEVELRLIRLKRDGKTYEALTNVLDTERLSAFDVLTLYPLRWNVERLFHQLKVVLNLKRFYCANPNAVSQQVFAAALVHAAFRIAQADIAARLDLEPEELSPDKLFPRLALASIKVIEAEFHFERTCQANRGVKLRKPSWEGIPDTFVSLRRIRVQRRSSIRRKREYHAERCLWKSFRAIEDAEELS